MKDRTFKRIIGSDNPLETARVILAPYNMQLVNNKIKTCDLCNNNCEKNFSYGNPNADILIVCDYATDIPKHKKFFDEVMKFCHLTENDVFVTHAVNCICKRSDGNYRLPSYTELTNCKEYTDFVIDFVKPLVIISMGAATLNQFTPDHVNLLDNIEKNTCYKGTHTIITYSVRDIFNFDKLRENTEEKVDHIIKSFNKAKEFVENRR